MSVSSFPPTDYSKDVSSYKGASENKPLSKYSRGLGVSVSLIDKPNGSVDKMNTTAKNVLKATNQQMTQEASALLDKQFPAEVAEKMKTLYNASRASLEKTARKNKANGTAKLSFVHKGTKYKIEVEKKKDGSMQVRCIGGPLAKGGICSVKKMVGIDIPKNLKQQSEAWAGVYYKPLLEEQNLQNSADQFLQAEGLPKENLPKIAELTKRLVKLSKQIPMAPEALKHMTPKVRKAREKLLKEELAVIDELQGFLPEGKVGDKLRDKLEGITVGGNQLADTKIIRREDIAKGFEIWKMLKEKNIPHLMHYYGVGMKDTAVVGSMAKMYNGDLTKIIKQPPQSDTERLDRLRLMDQIFETVGAMHKNSLIIGDFKPGNILQDGKNIYLADLAGVAKEGDPFVESTPLYSDPQGKIGAPAYHGADLYTLGLIMYELLYGPLDESLTEPGKDILGKLRDANDPVSSVIKQLVQKDIAGRPEAMAVRTIVREEIEQVEARIAEEQAADEGNKEETVPKLMEPSSAAIVTEEEELGSAASESKLPEAASSSEETSGMSEEELETKKEAEMFGDEPVGEGDAGVTVETPVESMREVYGEEGIVTAKNAIVNLFSEVIKNQEILSSKEAKDILVNHADTKAAETLRSLQKEVEGYSEQQIGTSTLLTHPDGTYAVVSEEKIKFKEFMQQAQLHLAENEINKLIYAYKEGKVQWIFGSKFKEIKEEAQRNAYQFLTELQRDLEVELKNKEKRERDFPLGEQSSQKDIPLQSRRDKTQIKEKVDLEKEIVGEEIKKKLIEKAIEKEREEKRRVYEKEKKLDEETTEIRREAWKKDDLKRDTLKESFKKESLEHNE